MPIIPSANVHQERHEPDGDAPDDDDVPMPPDDPGRRAPVKEPPNKEAPKRVG